MIDVRILYCASARLWQAGTFMSGDGLTGCTAPDVASLRTPSSGWRWTNHFANETVSSVSESTIFVMTVEGCCIWFRIVWIHHVWFEGVEG